MFSLETIQRVAEFGLTRRRYLPGFALALALGLTLLDVDIEQADAKKRKGKDKATKKGKREKGGSKEESNGGAHEVVKVAQKYEGAKYVWGGASPKGFDCTGFTWYVYNKAAGIDIGRTEEEQWTMGEAVGHGAWKDGDLVFFENTFERGLSHTGIYLSGGKFIHAENESTGVVVSRLDSGYYSEHYAGARRLF